MNNLFSMENAVIISAGVVFMILLVDLFVYLKRRQ